MNYLQTSCPTSSSLEEVLSGRKLDESPKNFNSTSNPTGMLKSNNATTTAIATASKITEVQNPNSLTKVNTESIIPSKNNKSQPPSISATSHSNNTSIVKPFLSRHLTEEVINSSNIDHQFCYRHNPRIRCNKSADEKKMTEIQKKLEKLPRRDQEAISHVWSIFSAAPKQHRTLILQGLISQCCFPQLSLISQEVSRLIKIDFLEMLPSELALKILCYLDCQSLCNAAQVSTKWKQLADDDRVWRYMCEQHIDRKCPQCGWGLPLMAVKKLQECTSISNRKRKFEEVEDVQNSVKYLPPPLSKCHDISEKTRRRQSMRKKRAWKAVYSERYKVERNWRKGIYSIKRFEGHKDGVLCCSYDNNKLLMTGSYDTTIKIWNVETGALIRTLKGHTMGVRSIAFDDQKLISGGLDSTIKVWNWRTGECISSYSGHEEGVTSVDFFDKIIVSGSADHTIKVWHVDTRTCYTLRGHTDWVTCVKIHPKSGTMFSSSDDATVRLWDLETNTCIKVYGGVENGGHIGQIQCVIPFTFKDKLSTDLNEFSKGENENDNEVVAEESEEDKEANEDDPLSEYPDLPTHMLTASLDNTIKLWDIRKGKCIRTQFGHIEGVWSIAADTFRIVSGAHDKLIKVWDLQTGQCMHTFGGHVSPVSCVGLGDSRIVCGLENGEVKMYCFDC